MLWWFKKKGEFKGVVATFVLDGRNTDWILWEDPIACKLWHWFSSLIHLAVAGAGVQALSAQKSQNSMVLLGFCFALV